MENEILKRNIKAFAYLAKKKPKQYHIAYMDGKVRAIEKVKLIYGDSLVTIRRPVELDTSKWTTGSDIKPGEGLKK